MKTIPRSKTHFFRFPLWSDKQIHVQNVGTRWPCWMYLKLIKDTKTYFVYLRHYQINKYRPRKFLFSRKKKQSLSWLWLCRNDGNEYLSPLIFIWSNDALMKETMNKISHLLTFYFYSLSLFISIQNIFARINHHLDTQYCVYVSKQIQCISPGIFYNFEPCLQLTFMLEEKWSRWVTVAVIYILRKGRCSDKDRFGQIFRSAVYRSYPLTI